MMLFYFYFVISCNTNKIKKSKFILSLYKREQGSLEKFLSTFNLGLSGRIGKEYLVLEGKTFTFVPYGLLTNNYKIPEND